MLKSDSLPLLRQVVICLGEMVKFLRDFKLHSILALTSNFRYLHRRFIYSYVFIIIIICTHRHFSTKSQMGLDGLALGNLEIMASEEGQTKGSTQLLLKTTTL